MLFPTSTYAAFLVLVLALYWALRHRVAQNVLLLVASYTFYGWVHPWFCALIAISTLVDYAAARGMVWRPRAKKRFLQLSLCCNLGLLGFYKYFGFFVDNVWAAFERLGLHLHPLTLQVFLPVGISFYTFQTMGYTIDVYRGKIAARRNLLDFALFVSFFPQLVAGPIERAQRLLLQVEQPRRFRTDVFLSAFPLLVLGYFKKLVVANALAGYVDRVYLLEHPPLTVLAAGTVAFTIQIFADFSAYTDIAGGSARLFGFELVENFQQPYLARNIQEFWNRWHMSLTTWIKDYLFFPLVVSRRWSKLLGASGISMVVMLTIGLWHGASWNFVLWGAYHGLLLQAYGKARPWLYRFTNFEGPILGRLWAALCIVFTFALMAAGDVLFRTPDMAFVVNAFRSPDLGFAAAPRIMSVTILGLTLLYAFPWLVQSTLDRHFPRARWTRAIWLWVLLVLTVVYGRQGAEFLYFRF